MDITYYQKISNSYNSTQQDAELYDAKRALLSDFDSNPSCKTILLNNVLTNVLLEEAVDVVTGGKSYRVFLKPGKVLNIGDILVIDSETWFVSKIANNKLISYNGTLVKSTCELKFYKNKVLYTLPCFITVGTRNYIDEKDNQVLRTPNSVFTCYCPDLGYIEKIDSGLRFFIRGYTYRVVGVDNLTIVDNEVRDGLITMKIADDPITSDDNIELGIANYYTNNEVEPTVVDTVVSDTYTIKINENVNTVETGGLCNITVNILDSTNTKVIKDCIFTITDGSDYATLSNITNSSCTISVLPKNKLIGSSFKLNIVLKDNNAIYTDRMFTVVGML